VVPASADEDAGDDGESEEDGVFTAVLEEEGAAEVDEGAALLELDTSLQERSYNGVVLNVFPTSPKLGLGVDGSESSMVNHHVLTFPKRGHPTSSQ